mgnify:CR=1 FL=1
MKIIARIRTDFKEKFGIPRQSGRVKELRGTIVFVKEDFHPESLRGIEEFSHLWLLWGFSSQEEMKVKCITESDYSLTNGKLYEVINIEKGLYRIIDNSGEDYLFYPDEFEIVEL